MSRFSGKAKPQPFTGILIVALVGAVTLAIALSRPAAAQASGDTETSEAAALAEGTESANAADSTAADEAAGQAEETENTSEDTTTLTVSVADSKTREKIGGAKIYVITGLDSDSSKQTHPDVTNDGGTCTLADLPRGEITIIISAQGMKSYKKNFHLGEDNQAEQTIAIELVADEPGNGEGTPPE